MNERIRELYTSVVGNDKLNFDSYLAEKFAELIVRECANIALKSGNIANKSELSKAEANRIYYKIQEHFGVE